MPDLLPVLLLGLKLSSWWYNSSNSPRSVKSEKEVGSRHGKILPPRPLDILPQSGLLPLTLPATPPAETKAVQGGRQGSKGRGYEVDEREYGKCPICEKNWENPSILPSGWVVCWRCGWEAVEGEEDDEVGDGDEKVDFEQGKGDVSIARMNDIGDQRRVSRRRGLCPFTGIAVAPGELRRVLV
jgi:peroxin-12